MKIAGTRNKDAKIPHSPTKARYGAWMNFCGPSFAIITSIAKKTTTTKQIRSDGLMVSPKRVCIHQIGLCDGYCENRLFANVTLPYLSMVTINGKNHPVAAKRR